MSLETLVALQENNLAVYCTVASFCVLLYDFLLTLGEEIDLIWATRWNLGKVLFFATRYSPLLDAAMQLYYHIAPSSTSPFLCQLLYQISGSLIVWGMAIAELVLVYRTWALWGRDSKFFCGVFVMLSASAIPIVYFSYKTFTHVKFRPTPYPHLQTCWMMDDPHSKLYVDYIVVVILETVILGLTIYKVWQILQTMRNHASSLVVTLYRDGVVYYIYLITVSLANILALAKLPPPQPTLILMQRVLHAILTARILLNLREAANKDHADLATRTGNSDQPERRRKDTALSSVILGVETWFRDEPYRTQNSVDSDVIV
ncbi:hypothetical protein JB92DRAFT_3036746 [Gautieria morchelliformis]|nr:hypothetical protein JB92DRAFT_3036746 [Gautieria morchelliformis]